MKELFDNTAKNHTELDVLGSEITSWTYKPTGTNKTLYLLFIVLAALVIYAIIFFKDQLDWIENVPNILIYLVIFASGPLIKYLGSRKQDQIWSLHDHGYLLRLMGKAGEAERKIGLWKDYKTCSYDAKGVKLEPDNPLKPSVRLNATVNIMEIYSICRERISIAQSEKLEKSSPQAQTPKTKEQRRLKKAYKKSTEKSPFHFESWDDQKH